MINGFLKASHLDKTVILDYWDTFKLFNNKPGHQLDKINVNINITRIYIIKKDSMIEKNLQDIINNIYDESHCTCH